MSSSFCKGSTAAAYVWFSASIKKNMISYRILRNVQSCGNLDKTKTLYHFWFVTSTTNVNEMNGKVLWHTRLGYNLTCPSWQDSCKNYKTGVGWPEQKIVLNIGCEFI
jgi:hypothetical protein